MQRSNPYIKSGYRTNLDYFACVKSVLSMHNETLNIWTHLLGFFVFLALLIRDIYLVIPTLKPDNVGISDIIVLVGVLICYQSCMFMSSIYHTFTAHSRTVSEKCLALDMVRKSFRYLY